MNARRPSISRRRLLQLALATGAAAGVASHAQAQTPRQGGTLKMAWASSPRTLDPALTIQGDEYMITQAAYDNLTRVDEKLQPQPMLATRWSRRRSGPDVDVQPPPGREVPPRPRAQGQRRRVHLRAHPRPEDRVPGPDRARADREGGGGRRLHGPVPDVRAVRRPAGEPRPSVRPDPARRPGGQDRQRAVRAPGPSASRSSSPASAPAWCGSPTTGTSRARTSTSCGR